MTKFASFIILSCLTMSAQAVKAEENVSPPSQTSTTAACTIVEKVASFKAFSGAVIGNRVRLRTAPGLEGHVVRETEPNELFAVIGEENDFYVVAPTPGTKGYVFRTYVLDNVVEADRVNVRLFPDTEAPIVGRLSRGEKIETSVSPVNNKWLELDVSERGRFYIAKDYIENIGPAELIAEKRTRHESAWHLLSTAFHFAQSELQRPFEQIDLDRINDNFEKLSTEFKEFSDIVDKAHQMDHLIQDIYLQKKISFLEFKADRTMSISDNEIESSLKNLVSLGKEFCIASSVEKESEVSTTFSESSPASSEKSNHERAPFTDKMLVWQPLEESLYHTWTLLSGDGSLESYYEEERECASVLTGILESYERPVKNRPGDFLLKIDNQPVAFLYSTKVDLQKCIGKKVTVMASPRPNNNFAFPAYFVLSVE